MVDVEHHKSVQVAACQLPWTYHDLHLTAVPRLLLALHLVKLTTAEGEDRQRPLQVVSPCQQLLRVRLLLPLLLAVLRLQVAQRTQVELTEVRMFQPLLHHCLVLLLHSLQNSPAGVDEPGRAAQTDHLPEILAAALCGRRIFSVLLITESHSLQWL